MITCPLRTGSAKMCEHALVSVLRETGSMTRLQFKAFKAAYPQINAMRNLMRTRYSFSRDIIDNGFASFGTPWADELEAMLRTLFPSEESLGLATKGYSTFSLHSMRLQARFEKERVYRNKSAADAASEVYFNEDYMLSEYLPGLLISHFLWPHHYRQLEFFDTAFVRPMCVAGAPAFVEVGIGSGLYSRRLLQALPAVTGLGLDISPSSKAYTERQIAAFGLADRYCVELRDVIHQPLDRTADWLVCVEVLEHLEDPPEFLRAFRRLLAPGGKAFITAALNAAHTDHIYLYRTVAEVEAEITQAGFAIEQFFTGAAYKPPAADVPVPLVAAFVVY